MSGGAPTRVVHCGCALAWLEANPLPCDAAILTSLPSADEFGGRGREPARWRAWFVDAAAAVLRATPSASAAVFFQTDVVDDGVWTDKAALLHEAARRVDVPTLWHKVVLRAPVGTVTNRRPGYAHLLCFARELRRGPDNASPDVLPAPGDKAWPRAMGADVARFAVAWLRDHAAARTIVAPFCGVGTALAAANETGLDAIGVERNPGRAQRARELAL